MELMINKFNVIKQKRILCCVVDNLDLYQSNTAKEISVNLTDFMLHRFNLYSFDIFIGKNEDELLQEASKDEFYTHAVIIACGTSFKLSDRIFSAIERVCEKEFFISGHILDRNGHSHYKNACFELHHQFYIVNLKQYAELGFPLVGQEENVSYTQIKPERSVEYLYNDHEVPEWIKPGTELKTYDIKLHGWNILNVGLENNKTLIDLGLDIRNNKQYIYYEYDHVFLREVSALYYNHFFCHNVFAPFNSDRIFEEINFVGPLEQYVTVGIGLNWIKNLIKLGYTESTEVIFTDINFNCLKFMEKMVNEWDGVDYVKFYQDYVSIQPNDSSFDPKHHTETWNREWQEFTSSFNNWKETWAAMQKLNYKFILIDYTSKYNFNWLTVGKNTLMNLSDLFNHVPFVFTQSLKYRIACENRLLNKLRDHDPKITLMLTSRASDGFRHNPERGLIGTVDMFDLTDINELKKAPWHITDWNSPKLLN
jgi:hypothetical protein